MARLFLIRHGEPAAAWGEANDDPGLTPRGVAQAEAAAETLFPLGLNRVISSPMRRCRETAAPFARRIGARPLIEPRVSEVVAPAGEDRAVWLRAAFPGAFAADAAPTLWSKADAALARWRADVLAAFTSLEEDAAVFTHFIAINAALAAALGRDETIVHRPAHAAIVELACEQGALCFVAAPGAIAGAPA